MSGAEGERALILISQRYVEFRFQLLPLTKSSCPGWENSPEEEMRFRWPVSNSNRMAMSVENGEVDLWTGFQWDRSISHRDVHQWVTGPSGNLKEPWNFAVLRTDVPILTRNFFPSQSDRFSLKVGGWSGTACESQRAVIKTLTSNTCSLGMASDC